MTNIAAVPFAVCHIREGLGTAGHNQAFLCCNTRQSRCHLSTSDCRFRFEHAAVVADHVAFLGRCFYPAIRPAVIGNIGIRGLLRFGSFLSQRVNQHFRGLFAGDIAFGMEHTIGKAVDIQLVFCLGRCRCAAADTTAATAGNIGSKGQLYLGIFRAGVVLDLDCDTEIRILRNIRQSLHIDTAAIRSNLHLGIIKGHNILVRSKQHLCRAAGSQRLVQQQRIQIYRAVLADRNRGTSAGKLVLFACRTIGKVSGVVRHILQDSAGHVVIVQIHLCTCVMPCFERSRNKTAQISVFQMNLGQRSLRKCVR